jgi:hypothetical protein
VPAASRTHSPRKPGRPGVRKLRRHQPTAVEAAIRRSRSTGTSSRPACNKIATSPRILHETEGVQDPLADYGCSSSALGRRQPQLIRWRTRETLNRSLPATPIQHSGTRLRTLRPSAYWEPTQGTSILLPAPHRLELSDLSREWPVTVDLAAVCHRIVTNSPKVHTWTAVHHRQIAPTRNSSAQSR